MSAMPPPPTGSGEVSIDLSADQRTSLLAAIDEVHEAQRTTARASGGAGLTIAPYPADGTAGIIKTAEAAGDTATVKYARAIEAWTPLVAPLEAPKPPPPSPPSVIGPLDTGYITFNGGVPVDAYSTLTLWPDGSYAFQGHFHDSGFPSYNDSSVVVVKNLANVAFTFAHAGHMAGTLESGSRDDNWNITSKSQDLANFWFEFAGGWNWYWEAATNADWNSLLSSALSALGNVTSVIGIVVA